MRYLIAILLMVQCVLGLAQKALVPGESSIDKKWIKSGLQEFSYCVVANGSPREIGTFSIETIMGEHTFAAYTQLSLLSSPNQWIDTSISEAGTFKPLYRSSFNPNKASVLYFDKEVTGYYLDKATGKKTVVKEPVKSLFFESYTYPYLLPALPLELGYEVDILVYDYEPSNKSNIHKSIIKDVKSALYKSSLTGDHHTWQVTVLETAVNETYIYHIDKETRKLWKLEVFSGDQNILLIDKEIDYQPIKSKFDKDKACKCLTEGSSVILGQAFARDNQAGIKGIAIMNVNKKQFAAPGTKIVLVPYTPYFKEWMKLNKALNKKGRSLPLPKEVSDCVKTTTVYDEDGHFEFSKLLPGEYWIYTEFSYVHTSTATEVVGYSDTYVNGVYQGSSAINNSYSYDANVNAMIQKVVTIEKNGDKAEVKLKKTL